MTKKDHRSFTVLRFSRGVPLSGVLVFILFLSGCIPEDKDKGPAYLPYDLRSETFRDIYDFGDRAEVDSLLTFFESEEPMIRYAAVKAFSSIRDSSKKVISSIALLLNDDHQKVASMAAYALGQTGATTAENYLINAFRSADTSGKFNYLNSVILEAIGKCGSDDALQLLSTITTYRPGDTLLLEGQSLGLYRFAVRGKTHPEGTRVMVEYSTRNIYPNSVRLIAANYLARTPGIDLSQYAYTLTRSLENERIPDIKMALALAVAKTGSVRARDVLMQTATIDRDYRVRANAVRALEAIGGETIMEFGLQAINDPHPAVSQLASRLLVRHTTEDMATRMGDYAADGALHYRTRAGLYAAALKNLPFYYTVTATSLNSDLRFLFESETNPTKKEAWVYALSHDPVNLPVISLVAEQEENPFLKTNALLHLENLLQIAQTKPQTNFNRNTVTRNIAELLRSGLSSGEPGRVAVASGIIQRNVRILRNYFRDESFFEALRDSADLPLQTTTYNHLVAAGNALFEADLPSLDREWNNPIDWELYLKLPDTARIAIRFGAGEVRVALPKKDNPGTVTQIVQLVLDGYYDGNFIHRVVSNFVIQGGCPVGDGYGSLDHTLRSELSPSRFDRGGRLGMASSGNHTESTQWFITHSPAFHLDGNYTNFGQVYDGMEVIHRIEVGSNIENIRLLNE